MSKKLPEMERRPDGLLPSMTAAQRKRANVLIRKTCCNYENGNCLSLDDGTLSAEHLLFRLLQQYFLLGGAYLRGFFVVSFALKYIEMRFYHFYLLRQLIQTFIKAFAGFKAA